MPLIRKSQSISVQNDPNKDGIPFNQLELNNKNQITRLIRKKRFNPKNIFRKALLSPLTFDYKEYQIKAVRRPRENQDNFDITIRPRRTDDWEVCIFKNEQQVTCQLVELSKFSDTKTNLIIEIDKLLKTII